MEENPSQWSSLGEKGPPASFLLYRSLTEFTHACVFNTRSECEAGGVCVVAVRVRACVHIHVLVLMAAADQAQGTLEGVGSPLVRLLALNRASGRFPSSVFSPRPTPRPPLRRCPFCWPPPQPWEEQGLRPHRVCGCPSRKHEPRLERPWPPFPWGVPHRGSGLLLPGPSQVGKGKEAS